MLKQDTLDIDWVAFNKQLDKRVDVEVSRGALLENVYDKEGYEQIPDQLQAILNQLNAQKIMYESDTFERISKTSMVDLNNLDLQNFPLFKKAQIEKFTLEKSDAIYIPRGWWHFVKSQMPSISVSIHYWSLKNSLRDLPIELTKVFLHDIGIYKKDNCACHQIVDGVRIKRG